MFNFASFCPHPPIIIPSIGKQSDLEEVSKTVEAMEELTKKFRDSEVDTVMIISPHSPIASREFSINVSPTLVGHFYNFGDFNTELKFQNDLELKDSIKEKSKEKNIPLREFEQKELDHGVLVPLYYLSRGKPEVKVINLSYSNLDLESHYEFGELLYKVSNSYSKKIGIVASGDLSHRLTPEAPAGYSPKGKEFDQKLVELIKNEEEKEIMDIDLDLRKKAGECGYRSLIILLGSLSQLEWESEVLSYQGPFGVGYLVASFRLN